MTLQPAFSSGTAYSAATPCGSARKTTSACLASSSAFGSLKRSVLDLRMAGELREDLRQRLPGVLARGDGDQFRVRMVQQQPDEFFAGVTGRADDGDFLHSHDFYFYRSDPATQSKIFGGDEVANRNRPPGSPAICENRNPSSAPANHNRKQKTPPD